MLSHGFFDDLNAFRFRLLEQITPASNPPRHEVVAAHITEISVQRGARPHPIMVAGCPVVRVLAQEQPPVIVDAALPKLGIGIGQIGPVGIVGIVQHGHGRRVGEVHDAPVLEAFAVHAGPSCTSIDAAASTTRKARCER